MTYHPAPGTARSERGHTALARCAEQIGTAQYARQLAASRRRSVRYVPTRVHVETVRMLNDRTVTDEQIFGWVMSPDVMAERW